MSVASRWPSERFSLGITICILFAFCAATVKPSPAQLTTLASFSGTNGADPQSSLVRGTDGNFYGTTYEGGTSGLGTVFKITPNGTLTSLHSFQGPFSDGAAPFARLVQGSDGNFYGTTGAGGATGLGTVFKITPGGSLTILHSFNGADGALPESELVRGRDGNFYGTTSQIGSNGVGTVFKITPGGTLTTLNGFAQGGSSPYGGLIQASDGNFYGTTYAGGSGSNCLGGCGIIFKMTPSGTLTTLHNFNGADGSRPEASMVQATDGNLYGTTFEGGSNNAGTVFKITLAGALTTLHSFAFTTSEGSQPAAGLLQANDGNFYGTTTNGGTQTYGTIFKITSAGTLTTLYSFQGMSDGGNPYGGLIQTSDGTFYGTTSAFGGSGNGTVFKFQPVSYTLTITPPSNGTVTSSDGFINCPGSCSHSYPENSQVNLTANPAQGYQFSAWGGACSGSNPNCTVTMTSDLSVSATFVQSSYTLTVSTLGSGTVTSNDGFINCPGTCTHSYLSFTPVTLTAHAASGWNFSGWSGACTGVGTCNLVMTNNLSASAFFNQPGNGLLFSAIVPCRLVDTRTSQGGGGPIPGGTYQTFNLPQLSQTKGCADLSAAAAYSVNVTLVPQNHTPVSYLTIWPTGLAQPVVSTMNSLDGRVKANAAIVPAGTNLSVNVFVTNTTDVVIDIDGFFAPTGHATLKFYPLTPCRVADTRKSDFPQGLGTPHLSAGVARDFPVMNSPCIPNGVTPAAYSFNLTAIPYPSLGHQLSYLEVWPKDQQPTHPVSTLNNPTGTFVANAAIVPAGTGNQITAYAASDTDLAIDINGYFAASGSGGMSLYPTAPCRVIDTRHVGSGQPFSGLLTPPVNVAGSACAPPNNTEAYVFNATVIPSPTLSYLTLWPDGQNQPVVSTLNAADGYITSNMAIVPNQNGEVDAYAAGTTQLILDISSYFAP